MVFNAILFNHNHNLICHKTEMKGRVAKSQTRLSDFHFHCNVYLAYSPWVSQAYNTWDVYSQIVAKKKKRKEKNMFLISIFVCVGSSLLHRLFSSFDERGRLSSCGAQASHCGGFP